MDDIAPLPPCLVRAALRAPARPAPATGGPQRAACSPADDHAHAVLLAGFHRTGGVWSGDEVADRMRSAYPQPVSTLARWIVGHEVLSFEWRSQILVPAFQFEPASARARFQPRACMRAVMGELVEAFDDRELATWFVQPNAWLKGAAPADEIARDPDAVFHAARADRFVAMG